ncbi:MAG: insulinase family protein [Chlorobiaceae bacterium]|nr:insulinase family protein [Chlorobiaceae bacterium]
MVELLKINYDKYKLNNGLEVILYQDKSNPIVALDLLYNVGSRNEKRGKTGLAHFFEHMMFQGSANLEKGMHFKLLNQVGGVLNASTSSDYTKYWETVTSNYLELILFLESERMGNFIPALTQEKIQNQIDVIVNERLENYDNQPYGLSSEKLHAMMFTEDHPYSWPTIGYINDIKSFSIEDTKDFFQKYYSPSNATLLIGGDFEKEKTIKLIEKYFGEIPSNQEDLKNEVLVPENSTKSKLKFEYEDKVELQKLSLAWHIIKSTEEEDVILDFICLILTGSKNGRLTKKIIYQEEKCSSIDATLYSRKYSGLFIVSAKIRHEFNAEEIKNEILTELVIIKKSGIDEDEFIRALNNYKTGFLLSMEGISSLCTNLNRFNFYFNEPDLLNKFYKTYCGITNDDIIRVANKFFDDSFCEMIIHPMRGANE